MPMHGSQQISYFGTQVGTVIGLNANIEKKPKSRTSIRGIPVS